MLFLAQTSQVDLASPLWQKVFFALGGAIITAGMAITIFLIQWRSRARKRLSFHTQVVNSLPPVDAKLRGKVEVRYNNQHVDSLWYVICRFVNTGNTVIKNQSLRFEFDPQAQILESLFDPVPISELDASKDPGFQGPKNQAKIQIGQIERGQSVSFVLIICGKNVEEPEIHSKGEGDVQLLSESLSKDLDDSVKVRVFIAMIVLYLLLLLPLSNLAAESLGFVGAFAAGMIQVLFGIFLFPYIRAFAATTAAFFLGSRENEGRRMVEGPLHMNVGGSAKVVVNRGSQTELEQVE